MSLGSDWNKFVELTKNKPPRLLVKRALGYFDKKGEALDLGAGALNESIYLLSEGFAHVTAVDKEPVAQEIAQGLPADTFSYVISSMEEFAYPVTKYDFITAQFALPFIHPGKFAEVWQKIDEALAPGGVFTGQLFGDRDGWAKVPHMTFHSKEQAEALAAQFEVLIFEEEEKDQSTVAGDPKHWHIFHFALRKK